MIGPSQGLAQDRSEQAHMYLWRVVCVAVWLVVCVCVCVHVSYVFGVWHVCGETLGAKGARVLSHRSPKTVKSLSLYVPFLSL